MFEDRFFLSGLYDTACKYVSSSNRGTVSWSTGWRQLQCARCSPASTISQRTTTWMVCSSSKLLATLSSNASLSLYNTSYTLISNLHLAATSTRIPIGLHSAQDGGAALLESADVPSSAANLKLFLWMRSYLRQLTLKCTVYFQHVLLGEELAAAAAAADDVRDTPTPTLSASRSASRSSLTGSTLSVGSSQSRPARVSSLIEHSALQRLIDDWHRKQPQLAARTSLHVVNVLRAASATGGPVQPAAAAANWSAFARVASGYQVPLVDAAAWECVARELSAPAAAAPAIIADIAPAARQISGGSNASATSTLTRAISDSNGGGEQAGRLLAGIATEMEDFVAGGFQRYSFVFSHPPVGSYRVARLLTFTPVTRTSTVTDESNSLECRRRRSCSARVTRRARARSRRLARRSRRSCSAGARS